MLPNWKDRPEITSNLFNPAFCSIILLECIKSYYKESGKGFPYSITFLVLPLILNNKIRAKFPKNKRNTLNNWINKNEELKIKLAMSISQFIPFTKETLLFGIIEKLYNIDKDGNFVILKSRKNLKTDNSEVTDCIKKASLLGILLSKYSNVETIYSTLGIKP